jgi:ABC-type Fe3+-hydroxamate transport system substrate-binding protein
MPPQLEFHQAPQRIVSLVPSLTESLFDLGAGRQVVGITDYCIHPAEGVRDVPRLGGPKNPRLDAILALQPDLVLANWEENTRPAVEALQAAGVPVWVTLPLSVRETVDLLHSLAGLLRNPAADLRVRMLDLTLDWAISAAQGRAGVRYFCPIWHDTTSAGQPWWMTFNRRTYCHDLLEVCGGENVFAGRERRYPLAADIGSAVPRPARGGDTRYPRIALGEIVAAQPDVILLPDDPYQFSDEELDQLTRWLAETPAVQQGRIHRVDGSLVTWAGTRVARALQELPAVFE